MDHTPSSPSESISESASEPASKQVPESISKPTLESPVESPVESSESSALASADSANESGDDRTGPAINELNEDQPIAEPIVELIQQTQARIEAQAVDAVDAYINDSIEEVRRLDHEQPSIDDSLESIRQGHMRLWRLVLIHAQAVEEYICHQATFYRETVEEAVAQFGANYATTDQARSAYNNHMNRVELKQRLRFHHQLFTQGCHHVIDQSHAKIGEAIDAVTRSEIAHWQYHKRHHTDVTGIVDLTGEDQS
ncbi:hypothetical protein DIURU_005593 [Diutina rugosa]|uniref:Uncharacterized protein n=1 Tax=Diutina rugosa TaxID=5481 RepID=A0A642UCU9_DIURU|nr:uncharacterized protein DIURU_005593 [Diutina rugosa]KAA8896853.1 hypothetical protein DIURU_005593 [Diutina rugosa]